MIVRKFIEMVRRQIYNGLPTDDATITIGLVQAWLPQAAAYAAKKNYSDNITLDGIGYVNNSFYSKFTGIAISGGQNFLWQFTLPQIPLGIGAHEGISTLELADSAGKVTQPFIPLSENQKTIYKNIRPIPNKVLFYYEGKTAYAISTLVLSQYTAQVTLVSAGNFSLSSELTVPDDYLPIMMQFLQQQLLLERNQPTDSQNDGLDAKVTT